MAARPAAAKARRNCTSTATAHTVITAAGRIVSRGGGHEIVEVEREPVVAAEADDVLEGGYRGVELPRQGSEAGVSQPR